MVAEEKKRGVAAVDRALTILGAFDHSIDGMTLTDLMHATGMHHSTILRLCESLEDHGLIKRMTDQRYMLGPRVFHLGMLYQSSFRLQDYALPVLRKLVAETQETAALYVREGNERICLHRLELQRSVRMHVREGDRFPLDRGAAGRVLLAFANQAGEYFETTRKIGYAVSLGERDVESAAIACPVFGIGQRLIGAISLGIPRFRFGAKAFEAYLPAVMRAGHDLTRDLGGDTAAFLPPFEMSSTVAEINAA